MQTRGRILARSFCGQGPVGEDPGIGARHPGFVNLGATHRSPKSSVVVQKPQAEKCKDKNSRLSLNVEQQTAASVGSSIFRRLK